MPHSRFGKRARQANARKKEEARVRLESVLHQRSKNQVAKQKQPTVSKEQKAAVIDEKTIEATAAAAATGAQEAFFGRTDTLSHYTKVAVTLASNSDSPLPGPAYRYTGWRENTTSTGSDHGEESDHENEVEMVDVDAATKIDPMPVAKEIEKETEKATLMQKNEEGPSHALPRETINPPIIEEVKTQEV
ncbi:hypothetical protein BDD12DRAFT_901134 [Trichophaea hybrida]|nr:hypothetical protein BDD12DRAFT_901134 [Trichophaea hybrida]